jgi:hypothetical protein
MPATSHTWRFFRAGGFDQPRIDTPADLLAIDGLDQKLWVALSCPVAGSEFDRRTLELIDSDGDGHIRAPELIAAMQWAGGRLADPAALAGSGLALAAIRTDDAEGEAIAAAARAVLADAGGETVAVEAASAAQARFADKAVAAWEAAGAAAKPLGEATAAAYEAFAAVAAKIDDFFTRCRLAAFDERAAALLNASEDALKALAAGALAPDSDAVAALPIAKVGAGDTVALPLGAGVNPAWAGAVAALRDQAVAPLLGARDALTETEWQALKDRLAPYAAWLAAKPDAAAMGDGVLALERLARYCRDLMKLANNFVAFKDFYTHQPGTQLRAMFQIGTLYLDGRACELVVAVNDAGKHAALASLSRLCLVYCDCKRGAETQTIAAAFTAGDSDQLMVGRNGVFYDRQGRDWDATIAKIVDHPISLRQAFWSPYKKLARMVAEQLQKIAVSKAGAVEAKLAQAAAAGADKVAAPPAKAAPTPFDVGKFAGIFAAIGLAVGALGTALASVVTGLLGLKWWQLPLALAGLLLVVSGPAVAVAWFKLRARNLGPLLDANGWAVNARARINIPFGTSLTQLAALPANAERSLIDPYAEKQAPWKAIIVGLFVLAGILLAGLAFVAH